MGRADEEMPSYFRCPISLDLMKYPVSLSTGVTYDLSSIQRWLDSGHNTCPATNLPLPPSPLFVPNLTLLRLIRLWSLPNPNPIPKPQPPSLLLLQLSSHDPHIAESAATEISRSYTDLDAESRATLLTPESINSTVRLLRSSSTYASKIAVAGLIETLASTADSKTTLLDSHQLLTELIRGLSDPSTSTAFLSCILSLSAPKLNKQRLVRAGAVKAIGSLLTNKETGAGSTETAIKVLEGLLGCPEGRAAICGDRECLIGVAGRLMRAPESGVAVLWTACCWMRDRRAREAVAAAEGGSVQTRILVVMQSGCSPAAKRMCGELLRVFKGRCDDKEKGRGYDTNSSHIMPF